jgi:hypothetical protein
VPAEMPERLSGQAFSPQLVESAKEAVSHILARSELVDLWAESDAEEWNGAMTGLIDRLNPEMPFDPPPRDELEMRSGYLTRCVFCDGEIAEGQVFALEFRDYSNADGLWLSRGIYCHLNCLNRKLHPRHLLQNWKFRPDEPPPLLGLLDE